MRLVRAFAALAAAAAAAVPAQAQNAPLVLRPGETLLEVEADGIHRDRPDVMSISAGVVTTGSNSSEAMRANARLAERLIETVRGRGVESRDIATTQLRVTPRFDRRNGDSNDEVPPRIVGYVANNNVSLRLRDLSRASELLDALLQAGANNVEGPYFGLSDERPARLGAQREAVRLAREEAENYAAAIGMRVDRILRISERSRDIATGGQYVIVTGSRIPAPPIEPGELETRVTVWVDFALAPQ